jgi:hypothetical protein
MTNHGAGNREPGVYILVGLKGDVGLRDDPAVSGRGTEGFEGL